MPTPSYSHHIVFEPLWLQLQARGHHITLFTTHPLKVNLTNFRQVSWNFSYDLWHNKHDLKTMIKNYNLNTLKSLQQFREMSKDVTIQQLSHPEVQRILADPAEYFDLVIAETITPTMTAFSHKYHCPLIAVSSCDITNFMHESLGNAISPSVHADFVTPFDTHMNFFERLVNVGYYFAYNFYFRYNLCPELDAIVRKYIDPTTPSLEKLQENASMVFLNVNPLLNNIRPMMPNMLPIGGGIHFLKGKKLPVDIQQFLDSARDQGLIYFSLGTNVKSGILSEETKSMFLETFLELPYKVLWKCDEAVTDNPKILAKSWLPQQQILSHPSVKLFITHGGMQSLEETVLNSVPILGIPMFLDQFQNIRTVVRKGLGLQIDIYKIDKTKLKMAIEEVIKNKKYKETAQDMSSLLVDKPSSTLHEMVRWSEYVMKHKGAKLLKATKIPLYQYLHLDIWAFVVLVLILLVLTVYKTLNLFVQFAKKKRGKIAKLE